MPSAIITYKKMKKVIIILLCLTAFSCLKKQAKPIIPKQTITVTAKSNNLNGFIKIDWDASMAKNIATEIDSVYKYQLNIKTFTAFVNSDSIKISCESATELNVSVNGNNIKIINSQGGWAPYFIKVQ